MKHPAIVNTLGKCIPLSIAKGIFMPDLEPKALQLLSFLARFAFYRSDFGHLAEFSLPC
jgi:hypothetical protein